MREKAHSHDAFPSTSAQAVSLLTFAEESAKNQAEAAQANDVRRVRVLFVLVKLEKTGAVLNALSIIRHLNPDRFEPVLFLAQHVPYDAYWNELLQGIQVVYGTQKRTWTRRLYQVLPRLVNASQKTDIIVGALEASSTYLAVLAAKFVDKPSLGLIQNSLPSHFEHMSFVHRQLIKNVYPRLTLAVGVSTGVKGEVEALVPALYSRVRISYNLIDVSKIRAAADEPRSEHMPTRPFILAAGRLSYQKGFDLLIRAYAMLKSSSLAHDLVILGDGPERARLAQLANSLGIAGRVKLVGFQENPYVWMRASDIFVSSSRYEGFCRVIVEALAVGVPVISTDCPSGPAEILKGGTYGVLIPTTNVEALARAIWVLLEDSERLERLGSLSLKRAEDFDIDSTYSLEAPLLEAIEQYKASQT